MIKREARFARSAADEVERSQIVAWLDRRESKKSLSGAAYNRLAFLIRAVFAYAAESGHIKGNPAHGIRRRREHVRSTFPDHDQAAELVKHASKPAKAGPVADEEFADFLRLAVYAGLRRGEIMGLRWENVDLAAGEIRLFPESVKTAASARTVPMSAHARTAMLNRRALRRTASPQEPVFWQRRGRNVGAPWSGTVVKLRWEATKLAAANAKVELPEGLRLHDLRRCFGSLLLSAGAELATIQELLGHSSYELTKRVYAHLLPETKRRAVEALDAAFGSG